VIGAGLKELNCASAGCTSCKGVIASNHFVQGGTVLYGIRDTAGIYVSASAMPVDLDDAMAWRQAAAKGTCDAVARAVSRGARGPPALVLLHCTIGYEERVVEAIHDKLPGVRIFGGSAANERFDKTSMHVLSNGSVQQGGIALTLFYPSVRCELELTCLHQPTDDDCSGVVTAAEGRRIDRIDDETAALWYKKHLAKTWSDKRILFGSELPDTVTTLNPLARETITYTPHGLERRYVLLHPSKINDDDGTLSLFCEVSVGERLSLVSSTQQGLVDAAALVTQRLGDEVGADVAGALVIYCAGMALELDRGGQLESLPSKLAETLPAGVPLAGMFPFGEQGPSCEGGNCHSNLMYNLLLFRTSQQTNQITSL